VRQWVLSLPHPVCLLLGYDRMLCSEVLAIFLRALLAWYRERAKAVLGLAEAEAGAVTVIQRFGSALNLNVHYHALVLDGVYARDTGGTSVRFHAVPAPSDAAIESLVGNIAARVLRLLVRRGRLQWDDGAFVVTAEGAGEADPLVAACQAASVQGRVAIGAEAGQGVVRMLRLRGWRRHGHGAASAVCGAVRLQSPRRRGGGRRRPSEAGKTLSLRCSSAPLHRAPVRPG